MNVKLKLEQRTSLGWKRATHALGLLSGAPAKKRCSRTRRHCGGEPII